MTETVYLRVAGVRHSDGRYQSRPGWETHHVVYQPGDESPLAARLLDADGRALAEARMSISRDACGPWTPTARLEVAGYLPFNSHATVIVVVDTELDRELYRTTIHSEKPHLEIMEAGLAGTRVRARWAATHPRPLSYNVALFAGRSRAFPLALDQSGTSIDADVGHLPGHDECHVVVVATDGVRSSTAISDPFVFDGAPARAVIISPPADARLTSGEPLSLVGLVVDAAGYPVDDTELVWTVDGYVVANATRLAGVAELAAGPHTIQLGLVTDRRAVPETRSLHVDPTDGATLEWRRAAETAEQIAVDRGLRPSSDEDVTTSPTL